MCGTNVHVDCTATHRLSCLHSPSRHHRHAAINNIIHKALIAAHIPSRLEPSGLDRTDGKHPDGCHNRALETWKMFTMGHTCPDTFAASYLTRFISTRSGLVVENKKISKHGYLEFSHIFYPVAIETLDVCGPQINPLARGSNLTLEIRMPLNIFGSTLYCYPEGTCCLNIGVHYSYS